MHSPIHPEWCAECRPAPDKTSEARGLFRFGAGKPSRGIRCPGPEQAAPFQGASCRQSVTEVAVREIAIAVIPRIENPETAVKATPEPAVKATPEPAVKAAPEPAVKTAPEPAAKTAGLGSPGADRGGARESNDRSGQQQLTGHETLPLTFLIRFHHRIAGMYSVS